MPQPIRKNIKINKRKTKKEEEHKVNTSNLEYYFIEKYLKPLKVEYIHQWKCPIGKIYDFLIKIPNSKTNNYLLIECDGCYYHCDPAIYKEPINEIQKKNIQNDKLKDEWALLNGIVLLRFWESDIYYNPSKVRKILKIRIKGK